MTTVQLQYRISTNDKTVSIKHRDTLHILKNE